MTRMTGNEYLARALRDYGVTHLFYKNSVINGTMALLDGMGIRQVITHGEKAAAYMADGYARAAHRPGVCAAQQIGTTNLLAGLRDPYMASSPVIAITGGQGDMARYRHGYQDVEDFTGWGGVTKANFSVDTVERLPDLLRQAFRTATSGAPGPVHLEFRGNAGQMLDGEADLDLVVEERFSRVPPFRPAPDPADVDAVAAALTDASRPIIVAGGGVISSGAEAELVRLAERLSIPVATSLNAKAAIADDHPLAVGVPGTYSRWCANRALSEADLVFFVGSHAGGMVTTNWQVPAIGIPAVQLDIDPQELGRNYPNVGSMHADVQVGLQALIDAVEAQPPRAEWLARVRALVDEYWAEQEPKLTSNDVPIRPERIAREFTEWLPPGSALVCDTFHAAIWTAQMTRLTGGQRYIRCAGSLGWSLPGTLGAKAALPDEPVIGFMGDAGVYYHLAELETAARCGLNAVLVVNNNYSGGVAESSAFSRAVSIAKVAEDLGCLGIRVERPAEIRPALDRALHAGRPALVEIVSDTAVRAERAWVPA